LARPNNKKVDRLYLRALLTVFWNYLGWFSTKLDPKNVPSFGRLCSRQSDQIGRVFASLFWAVILKNIEVTQYLRYFWPRQKLCIAFGKEWGWTTFWAIFLQTHLVTLAPDLSPLFVQRV
jgi:hypothetical protein